MTDNKDIDINNGVMNGAINIVFPNPDPTKWQIVNEDTLREERSEFVYKRFVADYPDIQVKDTEQVYKLCAKSKLLGQWLALTNAAYVDVIKIPVYGKGIITREDMNKASTEITVINEKARLKAKAINEEANKFKNALAQIDKDKKYALPEKMSSVVKVLILNTSDMPLTLQLAVDNYTVDVAKGFPDTKSYAREMLFNYKTALLKLIKDNPEIDIDKIIESMRGK